MKINSLRGAIFTTCLIFTLTCPEISRARVILGSYMAINSTILGEERVLMVYLPPNYESSESEYPVLYLLDAEAHFNHISGLVEFLAQQRLIPEMLVIGIRNTDRIRDFTPSEIDYQPTSGGADSFKYFLREELIPGVDETFRTAPYRLIAGHSLGGLFVLHTLFTEPDLFNATIAFSPSFNYDDNDFLDQVPDLVKSLGTKKKSLYFAIGGKEVELIPPSRKFTRILKKHHPHNLNWEFDILKKHDHGSVVHEAFYQSMEEIFANWKFSPELIPEGISAIQLHYKNLSRQLGYSVKPQELELNEIGYALLELEKFKDALAVFMLNTTLYPNSANVFDSLGDGYAAMEENESAIDNYQLAIELATKNSDSRLPVYQHHLSKLLDYENE